MTKGAAVLAIVLLGDCVRAPASPPMYRWVDENGVTVYAQSPPPSGEPVRIKKQRPPKAEDAAAAKKRFNRLLEKKSDEGEARQHADAERTRAARQAEKERLRDVSCGTAQANLAKLHNLGRRMIRTPDGQILRLSEEQVQTQIEKAQMQIEDYCTSSWRPPNYADPENSDQH